jgi:spore germination cell wall hydrolase CwlJ-like protein
MKERLFIILLGGILSFCVVQNSTPITEVPTNVIDSVKVDTVVPLKKKQTKKLVSVKRTELQCLANNIYYEAGNQGYEGRLAVATVTMNRVKNSRFPKTVCGVVYQRTSAGCQFSWTCGKRAKFNKYLYDKSLAVAKDVLTNHTRLHSIQEAVFFHNDKVNPNWAFAKPIAKIGNHIFYVEKRNNS